MAAAFTTDGIAAVSVSGILAHEPSREAMQAGVEDLGALHDLVAAVLTRNAADKRFSFATWFSAESV
jgi:hypothetical protein